MLTNDGVQINKHWYESILVSFQFQNNMHNNAK